MPAPLLDRRDLEFMLYELFEVEQMLTRERYADHNRETIDAALDVAQGVAGFHHGHTALEAFPGHADYFKGIVPGRSCKQGLVGIGIVAV